MKPASHSLSEFAKRWSPLIVVFCISVYVAIRVFTVSITHDEVWTILHFARLPIRDIVTYTDPIPNNHIFHTLLVKACISIGGVSQVAARLPNLAGFFLYAFAAFRFSGLSRDWKIHLFTTTALLLNPFLLDFFSLARGYGLSIDFMLMACWLAYRWMQAQRPGILAGAMLMAVLAVYTNFTTLNFYVPFAGLLLAQIFLQKDWPGRSRLLKYVAIIVIASCVLAAISYLPISRMRATNQFAFWGTNGFYQETLSSLVNASLGHRSYFGSDRASLLGANILVIISIIVMAIMCARHIARSGFRMNAPASFFVLLLLGSMAVPVAQYYVLGTPYLSTRTALFYYPLFVLSLSFSDRRLMVLKPALAAACSLMLAGYAMFHFSRNANLRATREWWFDENTPAVIRYLKGQYEAGGKEQPVTLDCTWYCHPGLSFYIETDSLKWLRLEEYHKELRPQSPARYYYEMGDNLAHLQPRYKTAISFEGSDRALMVLDADSAAHR